jgi:phage protein|nr:MAG TPA: Protein of unknown function (DUF669) [Caudoviricetes sp.]
MTENTGFEFGWEDNIEKDSSEFVLLEEGVYPFTVEKIERGRSKGEGKWPACNMAIVHMQVDGGSQGKTTLKENLILYSLNEWKLSSFFVSLGMKKKGEVLKMNWPGTLKQTGYCKVKVEEFDKKDGSVGKSNRIDKFLAPDDSSINAQNNHQSSMPPQQGQFTETRQPGNYTGNSSFEFKGFGN